MAVDEEMLVLPAAAIFLHRPNFDNVGPTDRPTSILLFRIFLFSFECMAELVQCHATAKQEKDIHCSLPKTVPVKLDSP